MLSCRNLARRAYRLLAWHWHGTCSGRPRSFALLNSNKRRRTGRSQRGLRFFWRATRATSCAAPRLAKALVHTCCDLFRRLSRCACTLRGMHAHAGGQKECLPPCESFALLQLVDSCAAAVGCAGQHYWFAATYRARPTVAWTATTARSWLVRIAAAWLAMRRPRWLPQQLLHCSWSSRSFGCGVIPSIHAYLGCSLGAFVPP